MRFLLVSRRKRGGGGFWQEGGYRTSTDRSVLTGLKSNPHVEKHMATSKGGIATFLGSLYEVRISDVDGTRWDQGPVLRKRRDGMTVLSYPVE